MAQKLTAQIVEDVILGGGFTVRFAAVSPTDGSAVSGVTVSNVEVTGTPQPGSPTAIPPQQLVNPVLIRQQQA